jgi:hypothetical protein
MSSPESGATKKFCFKNIEKKTLTLDLENGHVIKNPSE